jgi:iron-sulfur cluster assembly accessory protein
MDSSSINLTDSAIKRIQSLLPSSETNNFRVYVTGGGCSGFQYGFKFDGSPEGDDDIIPFKDFSILLDSLSYPYLFGSSLDFVEDLSGSKFIVTNP